jgi:beta-glucosidase
LATETAHPVPPAVPITSPDALVDALTLAEQAALTGGHDVWHLPRIPKLGLAELKLSDGPSGVRGEEVGTRRSLSFPCGIGVGSTWDIELVERYGRTLGEEARSKGVHVLLGPTVCLPRTPLGGRTFESFGEDPHLSSRTTVAYVRGVQSQSVACCVKHFALNDQETERMTISVEVDERALREIHLAPFEAAVREAGVWSIMGAYNKVAGTHCCEHERLLGTILKGEWEFDGVVVSDWTAAHSTVHAARAGLDVEMPGPPSHLGAHLVTAVEAGELDTEVVRDHARRVLRLAQRCGAIGSADPMPEREDDDPVRRAIARELVCAGSVLLRNDGVLPLDVPALRRVALIGPNAVAFQTGGGGSSEVVPLRSTPLVDELRERLPGVDVVVEEGCRLQRDLPSAPMSLFGGRLDLELFAGGDRSGAPAATRHLYRNPYLVLGEAAPGVEAATASVRVVGTFTADASGTWELGLSSIGPSRLYLDGALVVDNGAPTPGDRFFGLGSEVVATPVELVDGESLDLVVELEPSGQMLAAFEIVAAPPPLTDGLARAADAASDADVAIVVVGSNRQWESEGEDRVDLRLVGEQDELVAAVAAANSRTIVVLNNGGPIEMPWVDDVAAILNVWYPGEEGPGGLVDMFTGVSEPGGRLPITYPRRLADTAPAAHPEWFPGVDGRVVYGEGLLIGHRHFDDRDLEPLFPFGHGLSYSTFELGPLSVTDRGGSLVVEVEVRNCGTRPGSHVVQAYAEPVDRASGRPLRHLVGFAKIKVDAGATELARITLSDAAFRRWDETEGRWSTDVIPYLLRVGASSRDLSGAVPIER